MKLEELADAIRNHIRKDFDLPMVIAGKEGIGKSSFGYWLCSEVDPENFDIQKSIVYGLHELHDKILKAPRYSSVLIDEGMECFYKRDFNNPARKRVIKSLSQARFKNLFYAFCCPRFTDLDEYLRQWRLRLWIRVVKRGKAEVYAYDDDEFAGDPWHLNDKKLRRRRNYWGNIKFPDMPEEVKEEYVKIKYRTFQRLGKLDFDLHGSGLLGKMVFGLQKPEEDGGLGITIKDMARASKIPRTSLQYYKKVYVKALSGQLES